MKNGGSDTEQTPIKHSNFEMARTKENSTPEAGGSVSGGEFTQFATDSDINKDDPSEAITKQEVQQSPLMTIKEKLGRGRVNPVPGYPDSESMWYKLANIEKDNLSTVTRHPNNKSVYTVLVQDKVFKLRKNPTYTGPLNLPEL